MNEDDILKLASIGTAMHIRTEIKQEKKNVHDRRERS